MNDTAGNVAAIMLAFVVPAMIAPDPMDQKVGLIVHRSILTHGPWFSTRRNPPGYKEQQPVCDTTGQAQHSSLGLSNRQSMAVFATCSRVLWWWTGFAVRFHSTRVWQPARGNGQRHLDPLGIPRYLRWRRLPVSIGWKTASLPREDRYQLSEHPCNGGFKRPNRATELLGEPRRVSIRGGPPEKWMPVQYHADSPEAVGLRQLIQLRRICQLVIIASYTTAPELVELFCCRKGAAPPILPTVSILRAIMSIPIPSRRGEIPILINGFVWA